MGSNIQLAWRSLPEEEKTVKLPQLLKLYQKEVDRLTSRAKFSELIYVSIYSKLSNGPDTKRARQLLNELIDKLNKTSQIELENDKLKKEIQALKLEIQEGVKAKAQLNKSAQQLADVEKSYEDKIQLALQDEKNKFESQLTNLERKCADVNKSLSASKETIQRLKDQLHETNSFLNDAEKKYLEDMHAKQSEIDFLNNELDSLSSKVMTLEKTQQKDASDPYNAGQLEYEISQRDFTIGELQNQIIELESKLSFAYEQSRRDKTLHDEEINRLRKENDQLNKELQETPSSEDYEKISHHLELLKGLNYYLGSSEDDLDGSDQTVDSIIRDQLRRLERENIDMKTKLNEVNDMQRTYEDRLAQLNEELKVKDQSIQQLEETIEEQIQSFQGDETLIQEDKSDQEDEKSKRIKVLMSQRDRLKSQLQTLEQENQNVQEKLQELNGQVTILSNENVQLYKKIKYLQSYPSHSSRTQTGDVSINMDESDSVEDKYKNLYDSNMNPFADFTNKEKSRRYRELNPVEKVIYNFASFFMANKQTRMFLFFYTLSLHFLVFIITYNMASSSRNDDQ